jgi:ubiquinone/menaquinone biosynthesis C-methylase UbiE
MPQDPYRTAAAVYDVTIEPFLRPIKRLTVELLKTAFREASRCRILEIACGTGTQSKLLAGHGMDVFALDRSAGMIDASRQKSMKAGQKRLHLVQADATRLPFVKRTFDAVIVQFSLHEMDAPERRASLQEILRVAHSKTLFFLVDFVPATRLTFSKIILTVVERLAGQRHYQNGREFIKNGGLPKIVKHMGLRSVAVHTFFEQNVHLTVARRKPQSQPSGPDVFQKPQRTNGHSIDPVRPHEGGKK